MNENVGAKGALGTKLVRADGTEVSHPVLDRLFDEIAAGVHDALRTAGEIFQVNVFAHHFDAEGTLIDHSDTHVVLHGDAAAAHGVEDGALHLGSGLVTNAGVALLANDFTNATATLKLANYHDSGTGTTAAAVTDSGLQTPTGNARIAGTQSSPTAGQYRTVATLAYTASAAITEWGLLTAAAAGTLWDHKVFAAINVANGDSIQFTYTLTINAGG